MLYLFLLPANLWQNYSHCNMSFWWLLGHVNMWNWFPATITRRQYMRYIHMFTGHFYSDCAVIKMYIINQSNSSLASLMSKVFWNNKTALIFSLDHLTLCLRVLLFVGAKNCKYCLCFNDSCFLPCYSESPWCFLPSQLSFNANCCLHISHPLIWRHVPAISAGLYSTNCYVSVVTWHGSNVKCRLQRRMWQDWNVYSSVAILVIFIRHCWHLSPLKRSQRLHQPLHFCC